MAESPLRPVGPTRPLKRLLAWVDERFPLTETVEEHATKYYAPKNFNFWYYFGVLATVVLVMQLLTGIWLTMSYVPSGEGAFRFRRVHHARCRVRRHHPLPALHRASAFFVVIYLHMFRRLAYGSYRQPRELVWLIGIGIFLVLMAEDFSAICCRGATCRIGAPR